jgi:hypothetical protein
MVAGEQSYWLCSERESEEGQPEQICAEAVRILRFYIEQVTLNADELLRLVSAHCEISVKKVPLRYLKLCVVERVLLVLERHAVPMRMRDYRANVCAHLRKIIILVSCFSVVKQCWAS